MSYKYRPYLVTNEEDGNLYPGWLVESSEAIHCEGCGDADKVFAATWIQGEPPTPADSEDTMVIAECLPCFLLGNTRQVEFTGPQEERNDAPPWLVAS